MELIDVLYWAFQQNYHLDQANAAVHTAPVRYSPLTFRLAEQIAEREKVSNQVYANVHIVMMDKGAYEEDRGR